MHPHVIEERARQRELRTRAERYGLLGFRRRRRPARCSPRGAVTVKDRGRQRPGRPGLRAQRPKRLLPGPGAIHARPTFEQWLDQTS